MPDQFGYKRFAQPKGLIRRILNQLGIMFIAFLILAGPAVLILGIATGIALLILVFLIYFCIYVLFAAWQRIPAKSGAVAIGAVREAAVRGSGSAIEITPANTPTRMLPQRFELLARSVDLKSYILGKANRNVLICGVPGSGKSLLTRYLLEQFDGQKIIFSFKANDIYLDLGYPIVDMSRSVPDAFLDKEALVNAFMLTYPMNLSGITAQSIPQNVRELAGESGSWDGLFRNIETRLKATKDRTQKAALVFIKENAKPLAAKGSQLAPIGDGNIVFDFSGLNESAKTFYAELLLRQAWKDISAMRRQGLIICIDEAHRLTRGNTHSAQSIYGDVARLIRAFGMLWTTTQYYTDMGDFVGMFDTQFLFKTNHHADLSALREIDAKLSWAASTMPKHRFTDASYGEIHYVVPEFTLYYSPAAAGERTYAAGAEHIIGMPDAAQKIDYEQEVLEILDKEGLAYPTRMGKAIADKYGMEKDKAKLGVKGALEELRRSGRIASMPIHREGKDMVAYYMKDANESGLHRGMQDEVVGLLKARKIKIMEISKPGVRNSPDIETPDLSIEIETGLKHSTTALNERISKSEKRVVIVVPDETVKKRYDSLKADTVVLSGFDGYLDKNNAHEKE